MSGITGLATTYNLPNYTGALIALTPQECPLFSAIGGLTGGKQTKAKEFEWQGYDLRTPDQNVALEGASAPTAQARVRANFDNVVQIQQEKVSVSYSKLAATQAKAGVNNAEPNPVTNELDWQVMLTLTEMKRDIEWSFWNGKYQKPTDNATARKTRGIIQAITTNVVQKGAAVTGLSASTDTIAETSTGVANGDKVVFTDVGASTTIRVDRVYYVVSKTTDAFKVSATSGGAAITIGTATVSYIKCWTTTLTVDHINGFLQGIYDNGGLSSQVTLGVGSTQKVAVTAAYALAYAKAAPVTGNVGGVNVTQIESDFGVLNIMLSRDVPKDAIVALTLGEMAPQFLEVPGKGHFFAEPLAKTGASEDVQMYGEVGLEYGSQLHHGIMRGLIPA
ncbi:MAG: hypothetical protein GC157_07170 [Frankiales bacterium]|nr:hypothetical protein [Frankiales bacterium]